MGRRPAKVIFLVCYICFSTLNANVGQAQIPVLPSDDAKERVRITTDFVNECVARMDPGIREGDIEGWLRSCVNARLAKEGKPWRWNARSDDIRIEKRK